MLSRTEVFLDTQNRLWDDHRLRQLTYGAVSSTRVFPENFEITRVSGISPTRISVTQESTLDAARRLYFAQTREVPSGFGARLPKHIAILNFANGVNPGGGVVYGADAQEESLCRATNLYPCLTKPDVFGEFYDFNNRRDFYFSDRVIYSENVCVFKDEYGNMLDESQWVFVDVITCAAPNMNGIMEPDYGKLEKVYMSRIRNILSLAEAHGVHTLVLGAFGCGAFMNPPEVVAQAFAWQLMNGDFRNTFREVVFAIKADDQRGYYNYQVFSNYLYGMPDNGGRPEKWKGHVSNDKVPGVSSLIFMIMILCIVLAVGFGVLFGVGLYLNWFSNALVAVLMGVLPGVFIGMAILFTWQFLKN